MAKHIDIEQHGMYRMGLTCSEIESYLAQRAKEAKKKMSHKRMYARFCRIAGTNTGAIAEDGAMLMYRLDVKRFAELMFEGKRTYFD